MQVKNKFIVLGLIFVMVCSFVSAQETYIESMQRLREEQQQSKKEIIAAVVSFNEAFKDTFRLIDDEFSRLIYSMVGVVGVVFSIMFLVYAKTTSRYKRDIQILMKAHSKHIDNMVSIRLDEFIARLDSRMLDERTSALSRVEGDFDSLMGDITNDKNNISEVMPIKKQIKNKNKTVKVKLDELKENISSIEEPMIDEDGSVAVLKEPTSRLNRFKKRVRSGFRRLFGKGPETIDVKEFKE